MLHVGEGNIQNLHETMFYRDLMPTIARLNITLKWREAYQWSDLLPGILLRMTGKTASLRTLSFTFSAAGAAMPWSV